MAIDKAVDSARLNACLDAEADAIRAKTGGSADIPFDYVTGRIYSSRVKSRRYSTGVMPMTSWRRRCRVRILPSPLSSAMAAML